MTWRNITGAAGGGTDRGGGRGFVDRRAQHQDAVQSRQTGWIRRPRTLRSWRDTQVPARALSSAPIGDVIGIDLGTTNL